MEILWEAYPDNQIEEYITVSLLQELLQQTIETLSPLTSSNENIKVLVEILWEAYPDNQIETYSGAITSAEQTYRHTEQIADNADGDEWAELFKLDNAKKSNADDSKESEQQQAEKTAETKKKTEGNDTN